MRTFHVETDVCDVERRHVPDGQHSNFVSYVMAEALIDVLKIKRKQAKTKEELGRIDADLSKLQRAKQSVKEALHEADSKKAKLRRLILVKEAKIE